MSSQVGLQIEKMIRNIVYNEMIFLQYELTDGPLNGIIEKMIWNIVYSWTVFSSMYSQMPLQIAWLRK